MSASIDRTTTSATSEPLRCAVIGAGAMGRSLAALLGEVTPVTMVARDRAKAQRLERGVVATGAFVASSHPRIVTDIAALASVGPLEAIFVATKTTAIDAVADALQPLLAGLGGGDGGSPFVVSFQNGIEPGRRLMERLSHPKVVRMVLNYGAYLDDDGSVRIHFHTPPNFVGGPDRKHCRFSASLAELLTRAGLETIAVDDIEPLVWRKGIVNAAMNPVAALVDGTVGEVLDSPAREIVARLLNEGICVAQAEGIDLGADPVARTWAILETARGHTPSMVEDIRAGRPSEVGQLNRQIIEHAERVGVQVPSHTMITALIDAFDWRVFHRGDRAAPNGSASRRGESLASERCAP